MLIFIRPYKSNNVFCFYEDIDNPNLIKTISYQLDTDGTIKSQWEKTSNLRQLLGAIKSIEAGKAELISEKKWQKLILNK
ncbi:hypothetical protein N9D62_08165 [Amylibacter sp.]|nr:hypothetical protein [Amylibacter sp.]